MGLWFAQYLICTEEFILKEHKIKIARALVAGGTEWGTDVEKYFLPNICASEWLFQF